jgi:hypothetical protein
VPTSLLPVGENGEFEASILLYQPGTYEFTARAVNFFGTYSEPTSSQEVVITGTGPYFSKDATLSDLRIGGQTITGFDPDVYEYDVTLPSGTTEVPEVEADSGDGKASISITQAGTVTGMAVIVVTAEDGITKRTYTVKFNVAAGNVATLRELKVNGINVSGFDPEVMAYTVTLPYGTTAVPVVTATATDTNATVTIIPADSVRGTAVIQVTSADGSAENTYTVNFIVAANNNANLSDLQVNGVTVYGFAPTTLNYDIVLPSGTTTIPIVTAVAADPDAEVKTTQADSLPGTATVVVTAADGITTRNYEIHFSVAANTDASLSDLSIDGETIAGFAPETLTYSVELPYGTTEAPEVSAITTDPNAEVEITQADDLPGTATVFVTAADGTTTKTYEINFSVAANTDASLSDLKVDGNTVEGFVPERLTYNVVLPSGTTIIPTVTATATDPNAEVEITQADDLPGTATVFVTTADGTTTKTYEINFSVAANTDASLSDLSIDGETIAGFAPHTLTYNVELPYGTTEIPYVTATATDSNAKVDITQAESLPGTATVLVTAEDGITTRTYEIHFSVAANTDASLSDLRVDGETIEGFAPDTLTYNIVLPSGTTTIPTVTAIAADSKAVVNITQASSLPGTATVVVTAEDGTTTKTYEINFSIAANTDASLNDLMIDGETIEGFAPDTLTYNVELPYGTTEIPEVTATANDSKAKVEITQASSLPGTAKLVVTAEDGITKKTYIINFTVESAPDKPPKFIQGYPRTGTISSSGAEIIVKINENGYVYFVCLPADAPTPSSAQVKAGKDAEGKTLDENLKGYIQLTAGLENSFVISGLMSNTEYDIYIVAADTGHNLQATPVKIRVKTLIDAGQAELSFDEPSYLLIVGETQKVIVTLEYPDGSKYDVTEWANYQSENSGIVSIDSTGLIKGIAKGESVITATYGELSVSADVEVIEGCFIATAAYGSYLDAHVQVLRDFRDDVLLETSWGKAFVAWYYRNSPPIAALIAENEPLRLAVRAVLTPVVFVIKYPISSSVILLLVMILISFIMRRKINNNYSQHIR